MSSQTCRFSPALELMPRAAERGDFFVSLEEALSGTRTKGDEGVGFDDVDFGFEERQ